jgi:hypothetical protein
MQRSSHWPVVLFVWCVLGSASLAAAEERNAEENDRAYNGFIASGWRVHISHYWMGEGISSEAFAWANSKLATTFPKFTGHYGDQCLLIPDLSGYQIVILTQKRLSDRQSGRVHSLTDAALDYGRRQVKKLRPKR